jgi:threonylcarbamoyladenosine tRNA methylthiotransferase MtaB
LIAGGCREVVLTGIETASYGKDLDGYSLIDLLEEIDRLPGIGRVRLGSLDPSLIKAPFVERLAKLRSVTPHFHLSMQSGSDTVLARMKRKYNTRMALAGMELLRAAMPSVQFTTDMIVGFPQESDSEFEETMEFVRRARFLMIHVFPYSKRRGTPAATMQGQIPEPIKHERAARLSSLESNIRREILDSLTGQQFPVLFETFENGTMTGHTPEFIEITVESDLPLHAQTHTVTVERNDGKRCFGQIVRTCPRQSN